MIKPTRAEQYPTGQGGRVRRAKADIARRIKNVEQSVIDLVYTVPVESIQINKATYKYELDANRIIDINNQINRFINGAVETLGDRPIAWFFQQYLSQAYTDGTAKSAARIEALAVSSGQVDPQITTQLQLSNILRSPAYLRRSQLLYARSFENMSGFADDNAAKLARILSDGMMTGVSPRSIAANMRKEFTSIKGYRALRIARTEINKAFTDARTEQTKDARDRLGLEIKVMHQSALVESTRITHAQRHGKLYTPEAQEQWWSIGSNRINCLCSVVEILYLNGKPLQQDLIDKQAKRGKEYFKQ